MIFHEIKFKKRRKLLNVFEPYVRLKLDIIKDMLHNTTVIPVPLDKKRKRERDFNQSELLAKTICRYINIPLELHVLQRIIQQQPQSILHRKERLQNLKGAFIAKRADRIAGKHILLVDDVLTTGSTVNECARVLKEAGAHAITTFTLARAM